ncbi:lytic transglycosylase domain-containing protein [Ornithinibacillus gellani]|uniref:lytic transglycosylase domain-containing protein n=1 Tax=Ornithinibacillus gellani TaxID=2293253 RepID=UPI002958C073|nr:lytic transglycosylase domain-containing protein [Ornithinibacillus gellani]
MEIRDFQMQIQNQAMSIMMSKGDSLSYTSPIMDIAFRQILQDKINQASVMNKQLQQIDIDRSQGTNTVHAYSALPFMEHAPGVNRTSRSNTIAPAAFQSIVDSVAQKYNLDPKLIHSVIKMESNYNPNAKSHAGAQGLMQLMPATARGLGVMNPYDPAQNIEGGAKYLSQMLKKYNGNIELALAAYNAGPGNVDKYQGIPPFKETQNYVRKVMNTYLA